MKIKERLTKENCWNEMMELYPKATKLFCDWIDKYKEAVGWDGLFGNHFKEAAHTKIKFHHIPYEMQHGIWIRFASETLEDNFEQPEYEPDLDFREQVKEVLSELESTFF